MQTDNNQIIFAANLSAVQKLLNDTEFQTMLQDKKYPELIQRCVHATAHIQEIAISISAIALKEYRNAHPTIPKTEDNQDTHGS